MSAPLIIGHRGASAEAPENTLPALQRALDVGATWCEVDVQRTADDVAVLVHDDSWQRTAGVDQSVRQAPWSQVASFDVGAWKGPAFRDTRVPRLDEVLSWSDRLQLNLEIKSPEHDAGLALAVAHAVRQADAQQRTVLSCFDVATVTALATGFDDLRLAYLGHEPMAQPHDRVGCQVLEGAALLAHPDWWEHLRHTHVWAWTVDDVHVAERLVQAGVVGLITNDPRRLCTHFGVSPSS